MTIYLDYIFIENFFINYILLKETAYIARIEFSQKRLLIATFISSIYVVLMIILKLKQLNYLICKLLLVVLIIYIAFNPKAVNMYIKLIMLFFLVSSINIGALTFITNFLNLKGVTGVLKLVVYIVGLFVSKSFMMTVWKIYRNNIANDDLIYDVTISIKNQKYHYKAFLDTGNNVFSYTYNVPIIFAEIKKKDLLLDLKDMDFFYVTTVTLNSQTDKKAYIFENIQIKKGNKVWETKAGIVFEDSRLSKRGSYNMLLNYILYVQDLGGIKL